VDGRTVDQLSRAGRIRLTRQARDRAPRHGVNYSINVPVKRPGAYQLRIALRDSATGRLGSRPDGSQGWQSQAHHAGATVRR
jgi:hypothetical protein